MSANENSHVSSIKNLSPIGAWAFAVGTSIGWGSLVVTNQSYLGQAGPLGSAIGMLIGGVIMLIISRNYAYLMNNYPDAGGAYTYSKETFGFDQGFLTAWFLALTYFAMLWANATSLPLFARYFFGDVFRFGKLYSIFGYEVYLGEVLLTVIFILLFAFFCTRSRKILSGAMISMAVLFTFGIVVCLVFALFKKDASISPSFVPDRNTFSQIVKIACISPWAFIGFENISHRVEEFSFKRKRIFRVLTAAVISTTALYICIMLLSVTAYPSEYGSWVEYIRDLDNLEGLKALPAFYAAEHYMGSAGVWILMLSLLALIFTSLIGNITALSRLFMSLAKDSILPPRISEVNKHGVPARAVMLIAGVSVLIPLLGRTAIGWIVDVTTLGATLIYGFVSASAFKCALNNRDKIEKVTGVLGVAAAVGFGLYMLLPNLFGSGDMEPESFFLFVVWAILGFIFFRVILKHDADKRFGKSIIVWIALLSLVLFVSLVWMSRSIIDATDKGMVNIQAHYISEGMANADAGIVSSQINMIRAVSARSIIVVVVLFALSLGILFNNYNLMSKRAHTSELQLGHVKNLAFTDPLTGVKSKLAFTEKEHEIDENIANGTQEEFAVVVCDVNGLKYVNDTFGHKAGDEYIISAGKLVCEIFAHSPVYRNGGDEFVVILTKRDYENRLLLLRELHDRSVENIATGNVVVSAGMAEYSKLSKGNFHSVFQEADDRMYEEKKLLKSMGAATRTEGI